MNVLTEFAMGQAVIRYLDDTVVSPHDFVRSLYRIVSKGKVTEAGTIYPVGCPGLAIVAAESFDDAINVFQRHVGSIAHWDVTFEVEYFGADCRPRDADASLALIVVGGANNQWM